MVSQLQSFPIFHEVPKEQLEWYVSQCKVIKLDQGELLFNSGDPVNNTLIVLEGEINVVRVVQGEKKELMWLVPGTVTGYLPYSRIKNAVASAVAVKDSKLLTFPREKTGELIQGYFELTQALVSAMTTRVRDTMERQKQDEKMMALGKLSAGLAHELNNPVAAIASCAESLQKQLDVTPLVFKKLIKVKVTEDEIEQIIDYFKERRQSNAPLSLMERSNREEDFEDLLGDHNIENPCDIAENFVDNGILLKDIQEFLKITSPDRYSAILNWVNQVLMNERIINDIREASSRISVLVKSVKVYTHMDQSHSKQEVNVHDGILNTLKMLDHKLKQQKVKVDLQLSPALPAIMAYAGDLNQLWTNLIDNAIDAMEETENRLLIIKTIAEPQYIKVSVCDSGKGVPETIKDKIFDPFFTTKEVGKGTGLGLETVNSIVKMHKGSVKLTSVPGNTVFEVCLPLN